MVNTDAMQVYRGMDIGTAKLPPGERRGVPHHLLDLLDVTETATVAEFQRWPAPSSTTAARRGVVPVLVGGSALYTRAVLDRFEFPGTDAAVRGRLEAELAEVGPQALHGRLREVDPEAAAKVLPSNSRRVVRALEVIELTGRPFTASLPEQRYVYHGDRPGRRPTSRDRCSTSASSTGCDGCGTPDSSRRCDGSSRRGLREGRTANRALGYQQVLAFLTGELTEQAAFEADRHAHPAVRPAAGRLVPQGPADRLGGVGRPRPGRAGD